MVSGPEEDDVPTAAGVAVGDTTAEARPPLQSVTVTESTSTPPVIFPIEEDERTVRQALDPEIAKLVRSAPKPAMPPLLASTRPPSSASFKVAPATVASPGPPPPVKMLAATVVSPGVQPPPVIAPPPPTMLSTMVSPKGVPSTQPEPSTEPEELDGDELEDEEEPLEDSITATAPRIHPKLSLSLPGSVQIKTAIPDDIYDETEVKTMAGPLEVHRRSPSDDQDDGPTTQAVAPRVGSVPDLTTSVRVPASAAPKTALSASSELAVTPVDEDPAAHDPPTTPGITTESPTKPGLSTGEVDEYDPDAEESITTRGLAMAEPVDDESVTRQGPPVSKSSQQLAKRKMKPAAGVPAEARAAPPKVEEEDESPADEEAESITTQAPGHLTNMLRVIASGTDPNGTPAIDDEDDDDQPQNKTAVMIGAPVANPHSEGAIRKQPGTLQGFPPPPIPIVGSDPHSSSRLPSAASAALAARLEPTSDSGLRVARPGSGSGERVTTASDPDIGLHPLLPSDAMPVASGSMIAHAPTEPAFPPQGPGPLQEVAFGRGPRYGLLVGIVAAISILVPIVLFIVLRGPSDEPAPQVAPAQPSSDHVKRTDPTRTKKGDKTAPPASSHH